MRCTAAMLSQSSSLSPWMIRCQRARAALDHLDAPGTVRCPHRVLGYRLHWTTVRPAQTGCPNPCAKRRAVVRPWQKPSPT
jgi:hypothetical protein